MKKKKSTQKKVIFRERPNSIRKIEERIRKGTATPEDREKYQALENIGKSIREKTQIIAELGRSISEFEKKIKGMWLKIRESPAGKILIGIRLEANPKDLQDIKKLWWKLYRAFGQVKQKEGIAGQKAIENEFMTQIVIMGSNKMYLEYPLGTLPRKIYQDLKKEIEIALSEKKPISLEKSSPVCDLISYALSERPFLGGKYTLSGKQQEVWRNISLPKKETEIIIINGERYYLLNEFAKLVGKSPNTLRNWIKRGWLVLPTFKEIAGHDYTDPFGKVKSFWIVSEEDLPQKLARIKEIGQRKSELDIRPGLFSSGRVRKLLNISKSTLTYRYQQLDITPQKIGAKYFKTKS